MDKPDFSLPPDMDWHRWSTLGGWVIHFRYMGENFWYHNREWDENRAKEAASHLRQRAYLKMGVPLPPEEYLLDGKLVETICPGYELRVIWDRGWWTSLVHTNEFGEDVYQDEIWMEDLELARKKLKDVRSNVRLHAKLSKRWNAVMRK